MVQEVKRFIGRWHSFKLKILLPDVVLMNPFGTGLLRGVPVSCLLWRGLVPFTILSVLLLPFTFMPGSGIFNPIIPTINAALSSLGVSSCFWNM